LNYQKKMIYLSYMENEKRVSGGGYVKLECKGARMLVDMHVDLKNADLDNKLKVVLNGNGQSFPLGMMYVKRGAGSLKREIENWLAFDDICDIEMIMDADRYIVGRVKERGADWGKERETDGVEGRETDGAKERGDDRDEGRETDRVEERGEHEAEEREADRAKGADAGQFAAELPGREWQYTVIPLAGEGADSRDRDAAEEEVAKKDSVKEDGAKEDSVKEDGAKESIAQEALPIAEPIVNADKTAANITNNDDNTKGVAEITASCAQPHQEDVRQILHDIRMVPDKWQQLLKNYKQINPYADDRLFISLEPKDFVVLASEYQHLAHNSFLLHGYYNHRHIILGKENEDYYLGVPGVYYEREKNVAAMFGFAVFECEGGKAANGTVGYYLRKVMI
jgi:hypothetical protein